MSNLLLSVLRSWRFSSALATCNERLASRRWRTAKELTTSQGAFAATNDRLAGLRTLRQTSWSAGADSDPEWVRLRLWSSIFFSALEFVNAKDAPNMPGQRSWVPIGGGPLDRKRLLLRSLVTAKSCDKHGTSR